MAKGRKRGKKIFWCGLGIFALVFAGTFFGVQYFTKTGIFRIPGVVYYDESLNDDELTVLAGRRTLWRKRSTAASSAAL